MNYLFQKGEDIKFREIAQPPIEPILVNDKLVGSSRNEQIINKNIVPFSSSNSSSSPSTLSGSFSFGNLAYLPSVSTSTDFYVPSIASSCSIGALDQIRSTEITKLFDYLFLGSQKDALDNELLLRHGITRVINLSENCPRPTSLPDDLQHFLRIPVNDTYSAKLLPHFDSAYQFIETAKQEGEKVLIHCLAGISRSPTVAIAYVMRSRKMTNDEAYNFVKCRRPTISPNFNFLGQLFEYERILRQQNILPFNSSISSSPPKLSSPQNEELNEIKKKLKENLKNPNLQHKPSLPLNSSLPPTTMARPKHLLTSKEDLKNFRHSCPSSTSISFLFKSPLPNSPIPSPSNEFSKLDISFSNPCFGIQKKEEQQKIPPPPLPQPPPPHPPLPSSCDNKLKPKIISSIENPVFDIPIKIKTLSKIKEATINSKEEKKKTKKERKQINSHEPSFVSFLEKEEKLEFSGYKNSLSTRECLADTEGDELIKFGPSPEFGITPITFDKINEEENELTNKKKRKGKIISKSSLKSTNLIKETNNNKQQQQTKIKLYSNQFANATISSIQNLYKKLPQPPTTLLNNYFNENQKFQTTSTNIPKSSSSSSSCCNHRLFPQFGCRKRNNSDLIQQQKCIQCRKYSFKKSPLPTIKDDEKSDEEVEEVKNEKKEKEGEENKEIIYSKII